MCHILSMNQENFSSDFLDKSVMLIFFCSYPRHTIINKITLDLKNICNFQIEQLQQYSGSPLFSYLKCKKAKTVMPWINRLYRHCQDSKLYLTQKFYKILGVILFHHDIVCQFSGNESKLLRCFIISELLFYLKNFISSF